MERGELIVTTESPETARRIKTGAMIGSFVVAALLIWSSVGSTPQSLVISVIIGVALAVVGVLHYRRPESFGAVYEHVFAGIAEEEGSTRMVPFELPYAEITELRRFKRRGQEKYLMVCTVNGSYRFFCRVNQQLLVRELVERIHPPEA